MKINMTAEEKIAFVTNKIIEERQISPDSNQICYKFSKAPSSNNEIQVMDIVDEWKVLQKFEKEGKLIFPSIELLKEILPEHNIIRTSDSVDIYALPKNGHVDLTLTKKFLKEITNLEKTNQKIYWIEYKNRHIIFKGKCFKDEYLISKLQFDRLNESFFEYLYHRAGEKIYKSDLKDIKVNYYKTVNALGFKGELRKCFFDVSKTTIRFLKSINGKGLEERMINEKKLEKQIKKLPKIK